MAPRAAGRVTVRNRSATPRSAYAGVSTVWRTTSRMPMTANSVRVSTVPSRSRRRGSASRGGFGGLRDGRRAAGRSGRRAGRGVVRRRGAGGSSSWRGVRGVTVRTTPGRPAASRRPARPAPPRPPSSTCRAGRNGSPERVLRGVRRCSVGPASGVRSARPPARCSRTVRPRGVYARASEMPPTPGSPERGSAPRPPVLRDEPRREPVASRRGSSDLGGTVVSLPRPAGW